MNWTSLTDNLNATVRETFGREVQYLPAAGGSQAIKATFHETARGEDTKNKTYAVIYVVLADLAAPPMAGDVVRDGAANYKVFDIRCDQTGGAILACHVE